MARNNLYKNKGKKQNSSFTCYKYRENNQPIVNLNIIL